MIVDSSALVTILLKEEGWRDFAVAMDRAAVRKLAAPNYLETAMVMIGRKGAGAARVLDDFLVTSDVATIAFTPDHAALARDAFLLYGKGRHKAGLNFGDCIAYATARLEALPLLFKGEDFRLTDVEAAL